MPTVEPREPTLERLIREADEARLEEAVLEATGEDLLDRARAVSAGIRQRVRQVAGRKAAPGVLSYLAEAQG